MYVKIINPATNGKKVYANTGSARRTTNYLEKEAKENGQEPTFFSRADKGELTADEVVGLLDNNQKGLGKEAAKFYSLVLSPSQDELAQLGGGEKALEKYTREVMDLYAKNFTLKGGRQLGEEDLVWAATMHHERKNRGTDEGPQQENKPGLQTHVHVLVSARDADQKITLNPLGTATRFNRVQFQAQAGAQLDEAIGRDVPREIGAKPASRQQRVAAKATDIQRKAAANRERKPLTPEQMAAKDARLEGQVARLNQKAPDRNQVDPERVKELARASNYDNTFYGRLGQLERAAEGGKFPRDPYEYLQTGKKNENSKLEVGESAMPKYRPLEATTHNANRHVLAGFERSVDKLSRALAPTTKTQDVRSEEEKRRDFEHER